MFSLLIALVCILNVDAYYYLDFGEWGESCVMIKARYPTEYPDMKYWDYWSKYDLDNDINGYYKWVGDANGNGYYYKANEVNCHLAAKGIDFRPMYYRKSGYTYYLDPSATATKSNAKYGGGHLIGEGYTTRSLFDAPGIGPAPDTPFNLKMYGVDDSACVKTTTSDATVFDPAVYDDMVDDKPEDDEDYNPEDGINDNPVQIQPKLNEPILPSQPDAYSVSIDKWSLLIACLVFANIATIMAILYCREKNKNKSAKTDDLY